MKSLGSIAGVLFLCLTVSCHKDQIESSAEQGNNVVTLASSENGIVESDWMKASSWEVAAQPSHSVYHIEISADKIASPGNTILVFRRDNATGHSAAMPYEETKGSQKIYWYYEINGDKIMISADVYGAEVNPFITSAFKYLVVKNATMQDMERRGINRTRVMAMSYENFMEVNH